MEIIPTQNFAWGRACPCLLGYEINPNKRCHCEDIGRILNADNIRGNLLDNDVSSGDCHGHKCPRNDDAGGKIAGIIKSICAICPVVATTCNDSIP